jgi:hypothetical protein
MIVWKSRNQMILWESSTSSVYQGLKIQNIAKIWLSWENILFELTKYVSKKIGFHILVVGSKI